MRHGKRFNHLSRKSAHRKAMLANMASSLIEHKRIKTTLAKAKALRSYIEPLITKSKNDTTHSRRVVFSYLKQKEAITELFTEISTKIADRPGGYTRIIKLSNRLGDNAQMAFIELVDYNDDYVTDKPKRKKSRRTRRKSSSESSTTSSSISNNDNDQASVKNTINNDQQIKDKESIDEVKSKEENKESVVQEAEVVDESKESLAEEVEVVDESKESLAEEVEVVEESEESVVEEAEVVDETKESVVKESNDDVKTDENDNKNPENQEGKGE